jgi:hypothetical protein
MPENNSEVLMSTKRVLVLGLALLALAGAAMAGTWCHHMWPGHLPGIPSRNYQYRPRSAPLMALSRSPVLLQEVDTATGRATGQILLYQWNDAALEIDHCSISRVALQFYKDGRWTVSLRADQNPQNLLSITTADGQTKLIGHLKRNQFAIRFRCYGDYRVPETVADQTAGKPVLFALNPPEFWVQKAEPFDYSFMGFDDEVREFFTRVDRVELEFYYYH